jgi:hypothetical protein
MFAVGAGPCALGQAPVPSPVAPATCLNDQGVFQLFLAGRRIGSEKFAIQCTADQISARAETEFQIDREGKTVLIKTSSALVLNSQLVPLTYSWNMKSPQASSLEADFRTKPAKLRYRTVSGESDERDFSLLPDIVLIDNNVFHHFELLAERYRLTPGGKQVFRAFVPQDALPGELSVEGNERDAMKVRGQSKEFQHLVVTTDLAQIDLWSDEQHHLQRVLIRTAQLEAVRER